MSSQNSTSGTSIGWKIPACSNSQKSIQGQTWKSNEIWTTIRSFEKQSIRLTEFSGRERSKEFTQKQSVTISKKMRSGEGMGIL